MYKKFIKRWLGAAIALLGILCFSWLYVIIAIAILVDDPGPILFKQDRVGIHKTHFKILKFRTMKMDTPHDVPTHLLKNPDQYITRVGKFLRKTSLDEIPQLFNICQGGHEHRGTSPCSIFPGGPAGGAGSIRRQRHPPGLTGWAQINGRDELEIAEKARLDGEYVQNISFLFDCKCFFGTFLKVLRHDGVVEGGTGVLEEKKETAKK